MKVLFGSQTFPQKYAQLLLVTLVLFFGTPLLGDGPFELIALASLFLLAIAAVNTSFTLTLAQLAFYLSFVVVAFSLDGCARLYPEPNWNWIAAALSPIYALFLFVDIVEILGQVFSDRRVTGDTIRGGVCLYLLVGLTWSLIYDAARELDANAFKLPSDGSVAYDMVYFSFTTLTTLGYGDVAPLNRLVRAIANLQAIVGLLYPAVFIARLVSLYVVREIEEERESRSK